MAAVEALLCAGAYPCFRDNHLISPLHLASTQAGDRVTFQRIAELLGPSALLARDEVSTAAALGACACCVLPTYWALRVVELTRSRFFVLCLRFYYACVFHLLVRGVWCLFGLFFCRCVFRFDFLAFSRGLVLLLLFCVFWGAFFESCAGGAARRTGRTDVGTDGRTAFVCLVVRTFYSRCRVLAACWLRGPP